MSETNNNNVNITIIRQDNALDEEDEDRSFFVRHRAIVQIGVTVLVVAAAVIGVVTSPDPWSIRDIYIAVSSVLIGLWIPSPKIK